MVKRRRKATEEAEAEDEEEPLSEADFRKGFNGLLQEFFVTGDTEEAYRRLTELHSSVHHHLMVWPIVLFFCSYYKLIGSHNVITFVVVVVVAAAAAFILSNFVERDRSRTLFSRALTRRRRSAERSVACLLTWPCKGAFPAMRLHR